ncbi:MAG: TIGR00266 family protein [Methanomicrobiales archaeon]|nr:TIGR00266 family protein [Methanomicrobiales archaeon]
MEYDIRYRPSYSMLVVGLNEGEKIIAEAGSMTYMKPGIEVRTRMRETGILGTLGMSLLGRQSFFVNEYAATAGRAEAAFVSAPVGDIEVLPVTTDRGFIIQKSSYIASSEEIDLDVQWQGFTKGLFGQGLFMIHATGQGTLFINTFGAIDKHSLAAGESIIVDNFHLAAFSDSCAYTVKQFGGLKETILGGEGLVTEVTGPGEVYIQTKNVKEFVDWIWTLIEPRIPQRTAR